MFVEHALGHLGVAVDVRIGLVALFLQVACGDDALADDCAALAGLQGGNGAEGHRLYLAMDVDTAGDYRVRFSFVNSCYAN